MAQEGGAAASRTRTFDEVFAREVEAINQRRGAERPIVLEEESKERDGTPIYRPRAASNLVGLALSGGGVRSAAFCLGAIQALDYWGLIKRIDYLSTVSGGGYIGTSITVAMSKSPGGEFPFRSKLQAGEEPAVQHVRDHSNYLFPQGLLNIFVNVAVYLRGLVANAVLILPWLLLASVLTIWSNPDVVSLTGTKVARYFIHLPVVATYFGLTANALTAFLILLGGWALWRSTWLGRESSDVGSGARFFAVLSVVILALAFFELQPVLLDAMFRIVHTGGVDAAETTLTNWFKWIAGFFASLGAIVGILGRFLAETLKRTSEKPGVTAFVTSVIVRLAIYLTGAAVPIVLWAAFLYLSFWGIADLDCAPQPCTNNAPRWLQGLADLVPLANGSIVRLYLLGGIVLLVLSAFLNPNSNSLHRLYRDRLSKAFLFDPTRRLASRFGNSFGPASDPALRAFDLKPEDDFKVSELDPARAPYHLINAALNIEASKYANRRGRNADFYVFSPLFTGSRATGYVAMAEMERHATGLTAGSAMSVSGAAASSSMGSATIKPLVPTLAILNIRLGYWLFNPAAVAGALVRPAIARFIDQLYFLKELLGLLREDDGLIYLSDGGHIENLGLYELLRRRCKLIIAIDAESDPDMSFAALVKLERYARIDFGLRIDLPWAELRDASRAASEDVAKTGGRPPKEAPRGPHCALGTIYYPRKTAHEPESESTGLLLLIKSSFTGDENDYVVDYKRRYPRFPHETTLDQLFTEEQFEVYRALGFHAANAAFKGDDVVSMGGEPAKWQRENAAHPREILLRRILGLPLKAPPAPKG